MSKSITTQSIVRAYKMYAPVYDRIFGAILEPGRKALARKVDEIKPNSMLEIGVGTGLTLPRYPESTKVTGIDLSSEMLAIATAQANQLAGRKIELEKMDAEALTYPDSHFDCVAIPYVLSVTPNPDDLVAEARRVCKPGGAIIIVNHFSGAGVWRLFEKIVAYFGDKIGFNSIFCFSRHIANHDWKIVSVESVNLLGLSKIVVIENSPK
ncbi:class I SAM-dependent methyltransferase [Variovorax sp. J22R24]|uniref:class I SAM-dependent methyltransferase n=1 Tax=Variovorax gracilis TaxID=3053502 RepID=UPI0025770D5F|nr:class I SAM-dependent methyltransferase [Variovorax sp. J22R24]MDM0106016.1 class I SAM-dependent methyltransferase [Variovorax sp. J22R24]